MTNFSNFHSLIIRLFFLHGMFELQHGEVQLYTRLRVRGFHILAKQVGNDVAAFLHYVLLRELVGGL